LMFYPARESDLGEIYISLVIPGLTRNLYAIAL